MVRSFVGMVAHLPRAWLVGWFVRSFIRSLLGDVVRSFVRPSVRPPVGSFVRFSAVHGA